MKLEYILAKDPKLVKAYSPSSLYNLVPFLTVEKPKQTSSGYSASSLFDAWTTKEYEVNKVKYTGVDILFWVRFFYESSPKEYLKATQTKQPNWSSAVPIILYMYKIQHNIEYGEWDQTDPKFKYLMNEGLQPFLEYNLEELKNQFDPIVKELQEAALYSSKGEMRSVTSHILNKRTPYPEFDKLPRMLKFYVTKTWVYANPTKAMWACDFVEEKKDEQFPW